MTKVQKFSSACPEHVEGDRFISEMYDQRLEIV
jgi:hypothetical protein